MNEILSDTKIVTAIISAITAVLTIFILKPIVDRKFLKFRLNQEHKYEQRKKIKEVLAKNKTHLLNSAEELNHRLWNFTNNHQKNWHKVDGDYFEDGNNYFNSFIYRILSFYGWLRIIDKQMIYLDTTIASKDDLDFIKYIKIFPQLMCDLALFKGIEYDSNNPTDHFFRNNFQNISIILVKGEEVTDYANMFDDLNYCQMEYSQLCEFIDGISSEEERLRYDRLKLLHLTLLSFLNKFGYDFQYTEKEKIEFILKTPRKSKLIKNYTEFIKRMKLDSEKEMKKLLKIGKDYA
ncbi:hypothetical protein [Crocinitomix catalasitica]|uniref:hypothetical protein n=1 Tax=Crocinitomix catalasitica TaxID=184607 RepID=UPI00048415A0|nr:hypothetical protein [Crocinitomix catalasitica]